MSDCKMLVRISKLPVYDDPQTGGHMVVDKQRRSQLRKFRKMLRLKQEELAALAGVSPRVVARYERGKQVSSYTDARIAGAVFEMIAKKNPEAFKKAVQPALDEAEKWERVLSLEPGSEIALELEKRSEKSLAELKVMAETLAPFLRSAGNNFLSWTSPVRKRKAAETGPPPL